LEFGIGTNSAKGPNAAMTGYQVVEKF